MYLGKGGRKILFSVNFWSHAFVRSVFVRVPLPFQESVVLHFSNGITKTKWHHPSRIMHRCNTITVIKVVTFRCSKCEPAVSPVVGNSYQKNVIHDCGVFPKQIGSIIINVCSRETNFWFGFIQMDGWMDGCIRGKDFSHQSDHFALWLKSFVLREMICQ